MTKFYLLIEFRHSQVKLFKSGYLHVICFYCADLDILTLLQTKQYLNFVISFVLPIPMVIRILF